MKCNLLRQHEWIFRIKCSVKQVRERVSRTVWCHSFVGYKTGTPGGKGRSPHSSREESVTRAGGALPQTAGGGTGLTCSGSAQRNNTGSKGNKKVLLWISLSRTGGQMSSFVQYSQENSLRYVCYSGAVGYLWISKTRHTFVLCMDLYHNTDITVL